MEFLIINQDTVLKGLDADSSIMPESFFNQVKKGTLLNIIGESGNSYIIQARIFKGHASKIDRKLKDTDFEEIAQEFKCDLSAVKAVIELEAVGSGFFDDGRPKILFEAHHFSRLTNGVYDKSHSHLSSPTWNRSLYTYGSNEWIRLTQAHYLNAEAALQSTSWGIGQVMGFNFEVAGYENVTDFVKDMFISEHEQIRAMFRFIQGKGLIEALNSHSWEEFAFGYNGAGFKKNHYHIKLESAYLKFKK